jgi:hypothetical protein
VVDSEICGGGLVIETGTRRVELSVGGFGTMNFEGEAGFCANGLVA